MCFTLRRLLDWRLDLGDLSATHLPSLVCLALKGLPRLPFRNPAFPPPPCQTVVCMHTTRLRPCMQTKYPRQQSD